MISASRLAALACLVWLAPSPAAASPGQTDAQSAMPHSGDPETLARLEREFQDSDDLERRKDIAAALARAGRASEEHFALLESAGWEAVGSDRPMPVALDAEGNPIEPVRHSAEFLEWVKSFSGDVELEGRRAIRDQPGDILRLRSIEDPRIDAILMAGLFTPNPFVRMAAINVLVDHGHVEELPSIVQAARGLPPSIELGVGMTLLRLLDDRADEAARELIGDDELYRQFRDDLRAVPDASRTAQPPPGERPSPGAPRLSAHPGSSTVVAGQEVRFSCAVEGDEPVAFSWQRDGELVLDGRRVSGAETSTLVLYEVEPSDNGSYRCLVRNESGEAISGPGVLRVIDRPDS